MIKLRTIDPVALARETVQEAIDRVHSLASAIDTAIRCGIDLDVPNEATTLGHAVQALTRYAQIGAPLDASVHEYCVTLIGACDEALDDAMANEPETELGVVVAAAMAREALETGEPVRTAALACLAEVSAIRLRQLVQGGELRASDRGRVRADDARRWLGGR